MSLPIPIYFILFILLNVAGKSDSASSKGFSLRLLPLFSPESPMYPGNLSQLERIDKLVEMSKLRAKHLASMSVSNASVGPEKIHLDVYLSRSLYCVEIFLGTPKKSQFLIMDTGSHLIWTQCLPCINCFKQSTPIFDPKSSSTYQKIPCYHPLCTQPFRCVNGQCVYESTYADGTTSSGVLSSETFTFPDKSSFTELPIRVFGCANDNRGAHFSSISKVSGVLGLDTGKLSLLGQLGEADRRRFTYCFVPSNPSMEATSILRFGEDARMQGTNFKTTPFVRQKISTHFYLNLEDISVGGRRMGFTEETFSLRRDGSGGCIIDTGSATTHLAREPYNTVTQYFDEYFTGHGLHRVENIPVLEYCYQYVPNFVAYPSMTFHFQGADLEVKPKNVLISDGTSYFCVSLLPSEGVTVIGALQQQNTRFLYELDTNSLKFAPENCANDRL
ncbi:aspartic proteinase nepenthesin-2-like [Mangifera indica]|uniref:aspartic proteinase nepenthesin-2-like n=1 Tax=Mangifera indica TaxID=29780 RepID=UPI001CF9ADC0|nr:aspartic proteinase nepenthesin-2-like [Mangifera indica]